MEKMEKCNAYKCNITTDVIKKNETRCSNCNLQPKSSKPETWLQIECENKCGGIALICHFCIEEHGRCTYNPELYDIKSPCFLCYNMKCKCK